MAQSKTYYGCVRITTYTAEGSKWENISFRIHDAAQSSLDQLGCISYAIERAGTRLNLTPMSSMNPFKKKDVTIDFWLKTDPTSDMIYERELRIDRSAYQRGLDVREGSRYLMVYDPNHNMPPVEWLVFRLFRLLGIDLEVLK